MSVWGGGRAVEAVKKPGSAVGREEKVAARGEPCPGDSRADRARGFGVETGGHGAARDKVWLRVGCVAVTVRGVGVFNVSQREDTATRQLRGQRWEQDDDRPRCLARGQLYRRC